MSDTPGRDPIDEAYIQAEALLGDDDARAARRARVLAAVARAPTEPLAALPVSARRPARRYGGWLAAASIAGLSALLVTQIYPPAQRQPRTAPAAQPPKAAIPEAPTLETPAPEPKKD